MTITKDKKNELFAKYKKDLASATSAVIVQQKSIPVNIANKIRMEINTTDGKMNIIKKRIFLKALKDAWLEEIDVESLEWSVFALYAHEDEFGPLKIINKYLKEFSKDNKWSEFSFVGGWFEKKWQSGEYVSELANVPSKEELIAKLCYLFNYPLQSFACVTSEIAKKLEVWSPKIEEAKVEVKVEEQKVEEVEKVEEVKEETKSEGAQVVE